MALKNMAVFSKPVQYQAYLLRFWAEPEPNDSLPVWRFSLEDPHTGQRQGFADLQELMAFLEAKTGKEINPPDDRTPD